MDDIWLGWKFSSLSCVVYTPHPMAVSQRRGVGPSAAMFMKLADLCPGLEGSFHNTCQRKDGPGGIVQASGMWDPPSDPEGVPTRGGGGKFRGFTPRCIIFTGIFPRS